MTSAPLIAAALALAIAGSTLAALAQSEAARESPDTVVSCAICHDASFVVLPTAPASGSRAAR